MARNTKLTAILAFGASLLALSLWVVRHDISNDPLGSGNSFSYLREQLDLRSCSGWDSGRGAEYDPPGCSRARQYRQLEALLEKEEVLHLLSDHAYRHNLESVGRLKACLTGKLRCPPRPLIISGYWYFTEAANPARSSTTGEVIWMKSVQDQLHANGYITLGVNAYQEMVALSKWLPDLIHMAWTQDVQVVSCLSDRRCITPEHYVAPILQPNETVSEEEEEDIPESELGAIPIWRLFATDYWGSRPGRHEASGYWWDIDEDEEWSHNPLGQEWTVTPFDYPGHSWLPMSIEKSCMQTPYVDHDKRNDTALVYAKKIEYFYHPHAPELDTWSWLANTSDKIRPFDIISTAQNWHNPGEEDFDLPLGLESLGSKSRVAYNRLLSQVKALIGIGNPLISPSVYSALCQGVPVVIPYFQEYPEPPGWYLFNGLYGQHGPAAALGEPYVYSYKFDDRDDLLDKLNRAMSNPIQRYIPPDLKWDNAVARTRRFLTKDWHAEFLRRVKSAGGIPTLNPKITIRCYELNRCRQVDPGNPFHQHWMEGQASKLSD